MSGDRDEFAQAIELFRSILASDPDHAKTRNALRAILARKFQVLGAPKRIRVFALRKILSNQLEKASDPASRGALYQDFLLECPSDVAVRTILAECLLAAGHVNGAAAEAETAFADDPRNFKAARVLIAAMIRLGRAEEAEAIRRRLEELEDEGEGAPVP